MASQSQVSSIDVPHGSDAARRPLSLIFWDLYSNPEDVTSWSGISASIINGLRREGQSVTTAGLTLPGLKRLVSSAFWHFHNKVTKKHYIPDRHAAVTRFFSAIGNSRLGNAFTNADAILTTSTTATAFLKTTKPIVLIHDATWSQVLELYPYFHPSNQVEHVVRDGTAMERATFTRPNVTLVMASDWAARRAIADHQLDPSRVHVLPLGANFAEDPPRDRVEQAILARTGEHCNLLFVGKEFDRKGGILAVEAAAALREMGIPTTLHVVGCKPEGLPDFVRTYGMLRKDRPEQLKTLLDLYATSDFFILPTRAEAQGIVFNEAAAYGLPVAATNVGGVSTVVPDGGWGLLQPLEAPGAAYAEWIAALFRDRERYRTAALAARDDYEARLSRHAYTIRLLTIVRGVLGEENHNLNHSQLEADQ